jgi:hypothetical protein
VAMSGLLCCASFGAFVCCVVQTGLYCSIYNTVKSVTNVLDGLGV